MSRLQARPILVSVAAALLLAAASGSWAQAPAPAPAPPTAPPVPTAQEPLSAKLHASGMVRITRGDVELALIELNAHGPQWKHAPQASAAAEVSDLPGRAGKRFVGTLPVPNTDGGALKFAESVKALPQGLALEYDLGLTKAMKLNGLQVSLLLPAAQYAGKELLIARPDGEPEIASLPQEQEGQTFQVWSGEGARIEAAKGTDAAITIELRAAADVVVQDLRRWGSPAFEIRFPAIMQDEGRDVAADDRFHLDLTVTFPTPVKLAGP